MNESKLNIALIGAGNRGTVYADLIARHHPNACIAWVADTDPQKRVSYAQRFGLDPAHIYADADTMFNEMHGVDAVIVANMEHEHYPYTIRALEEGYHVLLEKPISNSPLECVQISDAVQKSNRLLMVCHVLRYTPLFGTIKDMIARGLIGKVMSIHHAENVSYTHMAHSYVRGKFAKSDHGAPMILAKSCHDLDILLWLADADCTEVASFGSLKHFRRENAPIEAPPRCTDGCPLKDCPYDARKYYLGADTDWPISMISHDLTLEGRQKALEEGPYGRCVYYCDNNVVDHQVVSLLFKNGVTASFSMNGFNKVDTRAIKVMGTHGEITAQLYQHKIHYQLFDSMTEEIIHVPQLEGVHAGGDSVMMAEFIEAIANPMQATVLTDAAVSAQSHLIAFAAEKARLDKQVVNMSKYAASLKLEGGA